MCGIAGLAGTDRTSLAGALERMTTALGHRGPDDQGIWLAPDAAFGFSHTRLSIVDLSPAGHQPMMSSIGRFVLVFNGEIYNHLELRRALKSEGAAPAWKGHSDTEVLLAGFEHWGIEKTLKRANGMFAVAAWNTATGQLTLARDRMGEKPLYFGWLGQRFAFASELSALRACGGWNAAIDERVAATFLQFGYVRGPQSIMQGIYRLPPGTLLSLDTADLLRPQGWDWLHQRLRPFWSLAEAAGQGLLNPLPQPADAANQLDALLNDAIASRMVADVPLGALLSGGIDSSLVTAIMQARASGRIRTFSIGFSESAFDEAPHARAVAGHLGTDHTELYVSPQDALDLIPSLPRIYDEPFADVSQVATSLLARLTRQHVKVALSGDGGDEFFAGYARYFAILRLWRGIKHIPAAQRRALARSVNLAAPLTAWINLLGGHRQPFPFRLRRLASRIAGPDVDALRDDFLRSSHAARWLDPRRGGLGTAALSPPPPFVEAPLRRLMYADQADYLPDDIMVKMDRATMAYGLESRAPLLDHRLVEFSWRLSPGQLHAGSTGKQLLREVLYRYVPRSLLDRPKQGFDVPIGAWLRGPLRAWAGDLLHSRELEGLAFIDAAQVRRDWDLHLRGRISIEYALWSLLMLLAWQRQFSQ